MKRKLGIRSGLRLHKTVTPKVEREWFERVCSWAAFDSNQSIDIRAVCLDLGSYGNRSTRFRDFVVGICESREY